MYSDIILRLIADIAKLKAMEKLTKNLVEVAK
jgi:hypothetical protein